MEELVTILLKTPGEPYSIERVPANDQYDFDIETAEKVLKIPGPIKQVFITKGPSYDLYLYGRMVAGDGLEYNFDLTNGERVFGPALFVRINPLDGSEIAADLRASGLELVDLSGLAYNPLVRKAWLTPSVAVNYLVCAQKPA